MIYQPVDNNLRYKRLVRIACNLDFMAAFYTPDDSDDSDDAATEARRDREAALHG